MGLYVCKVLGLVKKPCTTERLKDGSELDWKALIASMEINSIHKDVVAGNGCRAVTCEMRFRAAAEPGRRAWRERLIDELPNVAADGIARGLAEPTAGSIPRPLQGGEEEGDSSA